MAVQKLKLTEKTESKLGDEGIRQVAAHLWARDCQTCGGALDGQPPALYVIDMHSYAFADLHHEQCRAPDWNDSGLVTGQPSSVANLSHEALSVVLPFNRGGQADLRPSLLVNPGLELVQLELDDHHWQVVVGRQFEHAGLRGLGQIPMDEPVAGVVGHQTHFEVAVSLTGPPFSTYSAPIGGPSGPEIRAAHQDKQGVLLIVSHLFDFTDPTPEHISSVLSSGNVRCGWVGFSQNNH